MLNNDFIYNEEAVLVMVKSFRHLESDMKEDLYKASASRLISAPQRKVFYCLFTLEFNVMQTTKVLGYTIEEVEEYLEEGLNILLAVLNGYKTDYICYEPISPINFMHSVLMIDEGRLCPFQEELNASLQHNILTILEKEFNDALSKETLRQQAEGMPEHIKQELASLPYDPEVYPSHAVNDNYELGLITQPTNGSDYFVRQKYNNHVRYENEFNFNHEAYTGKRTYSYKTDDDNMGGKKDY